MTTDVRSSVSLVGTKAESTPSEPIVFRIRCHNDSEELRKYGASFRSESTGLAHAEVNIEPPEFELEPGASAEFAITLRARPPISAFPPGRHEVTIIITYSDQGEWVDVRKRTFADVFDDHWASLVEPFHIAKPSVPVLFRARITNPRDNTRLFRAKALGVDRFANASYFPEKLELAPHETGDIVIAIETHPGKSTVPAGKFLVGVQIEELLAGDPPVTLLSGEVEVLSLTDVRAVMQSPNGSGWRSLETNLQIRNDGDHAVPLRLSGSDPQNRFEFSFTRHGRPVEDNALFLEAGASKALTVKMKSRRMWLGRPVSHSYKVVAGNPGGEVAHTGTFTQRAVFSPVLFKILLGIFIVVLGMIIAQQVVERFIVDQPTFSWEELADTDAEGGPNLGGRVGHSAVWLQFPREPQSGFASRFARWFSNWFWGRDQEIEGMIVWGGRSVGGAAEPNGAFYRAEDQTWVGLTDADDVNIPSARTDHTAVWTGEQIRTMVVWGGFIPEDFDESGMALPSSVASDVGAEYDPVNRSWHDLPPGPTARVGHTMTFTGDAIIIIGGVDPSGSAQDDVWMLRPGTPPLGEGADQGADPQLQQSFSLGRWQQPALPPIPGARHHHAATWTGRFLVVFGGFDAEGNPLDDAYAIDPEAQVPQWIDITYTEERVGRRACHVGLWTGEFVLYLGGMDEPFSAPEAATQEAATVACRGTGATESIEGLVDRAVADEIGATDPQAWLVTPPPDDPDAGLAFDWAKPDFAPPQHLGGGFRALWTLNEATVLQAVPQLDTLAAIRYSPSEGTASLPLPAPDTIGPIRGFTAIWINGGIISWGGLELKPPDPQRGLGPTVDFSNKGAVLMLPDR